MGGLIETSYAWLLVGLAVIAEITAALALRFSNGFTKPLPAVLALAAFGSAFYLVSLALVNLPVSTVYPVWAGGGTAGVALLGILMLKERAGLWKGIGVMLIVLGIVMLNLAAGGHGA
ncbi:transporter [Candidatus Tenderia electrophaga]|mgnify:CR=1 FL=1|jgi:small multidrug resistance pump|uniref:Transporter n=1 Tax=Candidatus Tenderia electrophaga TaxID=1748243 RepID=A0A0S2TEV1_9GAMM|nr:transporter [Candidatus Tenderia electrophaga]